MHPAHWPIFQEQQNGSSEVSVAIFNEFVAAAFADRMAVEDELKALNRELHGALGQSEQAQVLQLPLFPFSGDLPCGQ